jgi:hypothetical protein
MVDVTEVSYTNTNRVGRGLGLAFTSAADEDYAYYKALAEKRISTDAPAGMDSALKNHCTMLMICHLYATSDPAFGMRSFSSGDMSGSQDAGSTVYLIEYRQIIEDSQASEEVSGGLTGVARSDATMTELQLDDQKVPTYFIEVGN